MPGGRRRTASCATDSRHVESSGTWNSPPTRERSAELSVHQAQPTCQAVGDARMDRQSEGSQPTILEIRLSPVAACCFPTATKSRRGVLLCHLWPSPVAACCFPTTTKSRRGVLLSHRDQVPSRRVAFQRRPSPVAACCFAPSGDRCEFSRIPRRAARRSHRERRSALSRGGVSSIRQDESPSRGLSLNRSQRGNCSTEYNTPPGT